MAITGERRLVHKAPAGGDSCPRPALILPASCLEESAENSRERPRKQRSPPTNERRRKKSTAEFPEICTRIQKSNARTLGITSPCLTTVGLSNGGFLEFSRVQEVIFQKSVVTIS